MAVCRSCGQENPEIARFCLACAAPLTAPVAARRELRKTVTVVFADIVDSTALGERLDVESLRAVMGRYFEAMSAAIERHGGTVEKFIGDAVMAVFGIPTVREDDALRAVRAAVGMRAALVPLNRELERRHGITIQVRIGVNSGEVVAGDPVGKQRYATGDAVNVAARLEQAAGPGEILMGEATYRLVRSAVDAEWIEPLVLKGKGRAVAAARLLAVPGMPGRRLGSRIVGREEELAFLGRALEDVVSQQVCRLVTVVGSAGVGKSRLVQEFLDRIPGDAVALHGRCLSYGDGITFWPIRNVVAEAAGLTGDESSASARAKIRSLVEAAPDADLIVERLADVAGVADSASGRRGTPWAIGRFFDELARRRPLVVVFDDIHWGEPTFLDLIEALAADSPPAPLMLLCMARRDLLEIRPTWGERAPSATTLQLAPLDDDAAQQLIGNLLGAAELSPGLRHRITSVTEGNPLFVEEVVAMLVDEGRLEEGSEISLPPTIQALLAARLDRLDRQNRALLERGSVEGKTFHRGAVLALSPVDERSQVDERLRTLLGREFLLPGRESLIGEQAFRFRHQLLRDVAYESLPKMVRSELHEGFATWLTEKTLGRAQEFDEILGHHLQQAYAYRSDLGTVDERSRALAARAGEHLGSAGARAYARGDAAATRTLLSRALTLLPSEGDSRADLSRRLDDARFELGEYRRRRLNRESLQCYWTRPVGHRWEMKESAGKPVLRCAACGKVTPGPRGWVDKRDDPTPAQVRVAYGGTSSGESGGGSAGGDSGY